MKARNHICILGESPLVEEYASLCLNTGFDVQVRINSDSSTTKLPKGARSISKVNKSFQVGLELTNISLDVKRKNLVELDKTLHSKAPILSSAVTVSVTEQSRWVKHPARLLGISALPSLLEKRLVELGAPSPTSEPALSAAQTFLKSLGKEVALVQDCVGMVLPRILCMLVNEAYFAMREGVATGRDIDSAMKLGTNYPYGPVEWGDRIGIGQVQAVVEALYRHYGEDRYRVAPMLRQAAMNDMLAAS